MIILCILLLLFLISFNSYFQSLLWPSSCVHMIWILCHRNRKDLQVLQTPVSTLLSTDVPAFIVPTLSHFYERADSFCFRSEWLQLDPNVIFLFRAFGLARILNRAAATMARLLSPSAHCVVLAEVSKDFVVLKVNHHSSGLHFLDFSVEFHSVVTPASLPQPVSLTHHCGLLLIFLSLPSHRHFIKGWWLLFAVFSPYRLCVILSHPRFPSLQ